MAWFNTPETHVYCTDGIVRWGEDELRNGEGFLPGDITLRPIPPGIPENCVLVASNVAFFRDEIFKWVTL